MAKTRKGKKQRVGGGFFDMFSNMFNRTTPPPTDAANKKGEIELTHAPTSSLPRPESSMTKSYRPKSYIPNFFKSNEQKNMEEDERKKKNWFVDYISSYLSNSNMGSNITFNLNVCKISISTEKLDIEDIKNMFSFSDEPKNDNDIQIKDDETDTSKFYIQIGEEIIATIMYNPGVITIMFKSYAGFSKLYCLFHAHRDESICIRDKSNQTFTIQSKRGGRSKRKRRRRTRKIRY